jgi:lysophospholipid acyltransferase (LPLAT)-like uncharacterized protein
VEQSPGSVAPLKLSQRLAVMIAPVVMRLLAATWRVRVYNAGSFRTQRINQKPFIFSLWHGQMLPLLLRHRGEGVTILISEHRDGELITQVAERLGLRAVRGSTTRGASRALLAMTRLLSEGAELAITPDGPRGPARTFAPGALIVAQRSGMPIIPIGVYASRAWRLRSWDAFLIPKPFATVCIVYGDPQYVDASDARSAALQTDKFQMAMNEVVAQAQQAYAGNDTVRTGTLST